MLTTSAKLALSFSAAFVGWTVGLAWYVAVAVLRPGFGYVTDFDAIAAWSGIFAFAAWVIAVIPLALRVDEEGALCRAPWAPVFGGVCGVLLCIVFLIPIGGGAEVLGQPTFLGQAFLVGGTSWWLYTWAARRPWPPRLAVACGALLPPIAIALFAFVVWPSLERITPSFAYRFGSDEARQRMFERTLRELRVGDSIDALRERLPGEFDFETTRTTGNRGPHLSYTIEFEEGRVTKVELRNRP
ncbi:MAG: hypothetical protein ACKVWV_06035 [Planctomycetota bacterium]